MLVKWHWFLRQQVSMSTAAKYQYRVGRDELFIAAPNDDSHIRAFENVCRKASYDTILEEWRVAWDGSDIETLLLEIHSAAQALTSISPHPSASNGNSYAYAQVTHAEGAESQIDTFREMGISDDFIFLDKLEGRYPKRPKFDECLSRLQPGDIVHVCNLNRVARSLKQLSQSLKDVDSKGAFICSLEEGIDTRKTKYEHFIEFVSCAKDFDIEANRLRTKAGIKEATAKGRRGGGRRRVLTKGKIELIAKLFCNGMTASAVSEIVETSRATIYRAFPGGLNSIRTAYEKDGQKGVDDLVKTVVQELETETYGSLKQKVLYLHNVESLTAPDIADRTGLNRETVRRYIQEGT